MAKNKAKSVTVKRNKAHQVKAGVRRANPTNKRIARRTADSRNVRNAKGTIKGNADRHVNKVLKKAVGGTAIHSKNRAEKNKTYFGKRVQSAAKQVKRTADATSVQRKRKAKISVNIPSVEDSRKVLNIISSNSVAVNYITKNISKRVMEVLNLLETPTSDEEIAQTLDMKINAVRRILNIAQEYGITNYYVTKNTNGWLSFAWYINANKLPYFLDYINSNNKVKSVINDECNDYFVCKTCYEKDKVVFTFDAAFENGFKCNICKSDFVRMDREEARKLIYPEAEITKKEEALMPAP